MTVSRLETADRQPSVDQTRGHPSSCPSNRILYPASSATSRARSLQSGSKMLARKCPTVPLVVEIVDDDAAAAVCREYHDCGGDGGGGDCADR